MLSYFLDDGLSLPHDPLAFAMVLGEFLDALVLPKIAV